jgi:NADH-quinone oxidoreductase subunit K
MNTAITLNHYLMASGVLFSLGLAGVILRRNLIIIYMCLEMMLNAANLSLVAFSRFQKTAEGASGLDGQIMVFFVITVAAAEVAVGLALIVALYRLKQTTNVGDLNSLKF